MKMGRDDPVTLWHVPQSRSFRVLWFLHEAGLPHRVNIMDFAGKSLRDRDFLAISPAGRVPAVRIGGQAMFESGAIMEYLCETRVPALGRAPGHPERRAFLEWLHFAETIGQHLAQLTQQHIVLREDWMRSPTVIKLETMRLARVLGGGGRCGAGTGLAAAAWVFRSGCRCGLRRAPGAPLCGGGRHSRAGRLSRPTDRAPGVSDRTGRGWSRDHLYPPLL